MLSWLSVFLLEFEVHSHWASCGSQRCYSLLLLDETIVLYRFLEMERVRDSLSRTKGYEWKTRKDDSGQLARGRDKKVKDKNSGAIDSRSCPQKTDGRNDVQARNKVTFLKRATAARRPKGPRDLPSRSQANNNFNSKSPNNIQHLPVLSF